MSLTFSAGDNQDKIAIIGRWQQMSIGGVSSLVMINSGGRVRFRFTGTSLQFAFDVITGYTDYPAVEISIDGEAYTRTTISISTLSAASGLDAGNHTCDLWVSAVSGDSQDSGKWSNYMGARLKQITVDDGCTISSWPTNLPRMLTIGDSIACGELLLANDLTCAGTSARHAFPARVAALLGYENWFIGSGGAGFCTTWQGYPQCQDSYLYKMSGYVHGDPQFDIVLIEAINNDSCSGTTLQGYYQTLIDRIRTDQLSAKIFCMGRIFGTPSDDADVRAVALANGCIYISPLLWSFTNPNVSHQDYGGHISVASYVARIIRMYMDRNNFFNWRLSDTHLDAYWHGNTGGLDVKSLTLPTFVGSISLLSPAAINGDQGLSVPGSTGSYFTSGTGMSSFPNGFACRWSGKPVAWTAGVILSKVSATSPYGGFNCGADASGHFLFSLNVSGTWTDLATSKAFPAGFVYRVIFSYDNLTMKIYVNGVLEASVSAAGVISFQNSSQPVWIGANQYTGNNSINGVIGELEIDNVAPTYDEVQADYSRYSAQVGGSNGNYY